MRLTTEVWLKVESKGRPEFNETKQLTIRETIKFLAEWLMKAYMGSHIEIRIGRRLEDLKPERIKSDTDMLEDLEQMLANVEESDEPDETAETAE